VGQSTHAHPLDVISCGFLPILLTRYHMRNLFLKYIEFVRNQNPTSWWDFAFGVIAIPGSWLMVPVVWLHFDLFRKLGIESPFPW
jgi:hypothetical protein